MLRIFSFILLIFLSFSCKEKKDSSFDLNENKTNNVVQVDYFKKISDSLNFLKNDTIISLNLSKKSLNRFPNLSRFYIENLDLSENLIDSINETYLPNGIKKFNLSKNKLNSFSLAKGCYNNLTSLDLSNNSIEYVYLKCAISKLNISNNNLGKLYVISFNNKRMKYLNVSNNPNFDNVIEFSTELIDSIEHKNIKNNKDLISSWKLIKNKPIE